MNAATAAHTPLLPSTATRAGRIASWTLQIIAAGILGQTLFFKFSGAPESVYIFSKLGVEPWGRYLAGTTEIVAVILLLTPRLAVAGAAMTLGVMAGAIASHLGPLGVVVEDDGGLLFGLALAVTACAGGVLVLRRAEMRSLLTRARKLVGS
jgi:putative oxidoreductase